MGTVPTLTAREHQSPQSACRSERTITVCRETEGGREGGRERNTGEVYFFLGQTDISKCLFMNHLIRKLFHAGAKDVGANGSEIGWDWW